jgi:hypothetical protein
MRLALDPVQSDFLSMNIKRSEEKPYNIHELPSIDGETLKCTPLFCKRFRQKNFKASRDAR